MTADRPLFSIVISTYNRALMVRTALRTAQSQTLDDWECIVVDDGSTDDTREVLAPFGADPRIRIVYAAVNKGMNAARNLAIERASGRFITILDSDDLWLPRRLERFRARIEETPEAGFLFSNAYVLRFGRIVGTQFDAGRSIPEGVVPGYFAVGEDQLPYVTTNLAIRRDAYTRWGLYKPEMRTSDTELYARFVGKGLPVAVIREPLSVRRIHGSQLTDRYAENFSEALVALESSGASAEARSRTRESICREVAVYLLKAGRPLDARGFLLKEMGARARPTALFLMTYIPTLLLRSARELRRSWLTLRHHPAFASKDVREVHRFIGPLLADESATAGRKPAR